MGATLNVGRVAMVGALGSSSVCAQQTVSCSEDVCATLAIERSRQAANGEKWLCELHDGKCVCTADGIPDINTFDCLSQEEL